MFDVPVCSGLTIWSKRNLQESMVSVLNGQRRWKLHNSDLTYSSSSIVFRHQSNPSAFHSLVPRGSCESVSTAHAGCSYSPIHLD